MSLTRNLKEIIVTIAALTAYGVVFLCVIGAVLFLLFGILAVWNAFYQLLS